MKNLILSLLLILLFLIGLTQLNMLRALHEHSKALINHEQVIQKFRMQQGIAKPGIESN
jgi:hypothetical protein